MSCIYFLHGSELQGDQCCMWKKTAVCLIKTFITASLCHFFIKVLQWVTPPISEGNKILTSVDSTRIIRQVLITIGFYFWSTCKSHIAAEALILLQAIFSFQSRLYSSAGHGQKCMKSEWVQGKYVSAASTLSAPLPWLVAYRVKFCSVLSTSTNTAARLTFASYDAKTTVAFFFFASL